MPNSQFSVCDLPPESQIFAIILILMVELWLGKTNKVQAGSILELVRNMLVPPTKQLVDPNAKPADVPQQEKKDGT